LFDGRVLVVGGFGGAASAELYDPASQKWKWANEGLTSSFLTDHTATRLQDGTVLVTGGLGTLEQPIKTCAIFRPDIEKWHPTGDLNLPRPGHTTSLLPSGQVLAVGGFGQSTEFFDPATEVWTLGSDTTTARTSHTATLIPERTRRINSSFEVLGAGGASDALRTLYSAEIYTDREVAV
jgi:hypothetical protein